MAAEGDESQGDVQGVACCATLRGVMCFTVGCVLGFVGQRATIMRSARELKVNKCEMMGWCVIWNLKTVLRMALKTLIFTSIANAPTFYGLLRRARRKAREEYARKIVDVYAGVV